RPKDFNYDDYYDCYLCPANHVLTYRTTNRQGYREYQSSPEDCQNCPYQKLQKTEKDKPQK
ncbi:MAG: IS5/IS1182 family transposase, partial [Streptococcus sp.]|nr:IS5/IS1182 family transposase [Streptococcus sp.]MDY5269104.1 IS5/IS1182 family transposase [Streptococcus sp.]